MQLDFYFDTRIQTTHVEDHGLSLRDIYLFFSQENYLERKRKDGSFEAVGIVGTIEIKVIFRKKGTKKEKHFFVITAYPYQLTETDHLLLGKELDEN